MGEVMTKNENLIENINKKMEYSNIVPIWKFVLLSILSFDFYQFYWFYKNWKDLKTSFAEYKTIHPILRTIGLFIPFWGLYMLYLQFKAIQTKRNQLATSYSKINIIVLIIIYFTMSFLSRLKSPYNLLVCINFLPFIFIQNELNILWENNETEKKNIFLSIPEFFIIILGLLVWFNEICYHFGKIK